MYSELIGKHPGVIAPVTIWKPNPLEFVKPVSASRVSGIMEVELKIREGNEALEKNLKKIVLTIDGKRFEFDKPPCGLHLTPPLPGSGLLHSRRRQSEKRMTRMMPCLPRFTPM